MPRRNSREQQQEEENMRFMRVQTAQLMMMLPQILQLYRNLMGFVMAANNARVAGRGRAAAAGRGRGGRAAGRGCHGGRAAVAGSDLDSEEDGIALDDSRPLRSAASN